MLVNVHELTIQYHYKNIGNVTLFQIKFFLFHFNL